MPPLTPSRIRLMPGLCLRRGTDAAATRAGVPLRATVYSYLILPSAISSRDMVR